MRVAILGGGVAGIGSAIALRQKGIDVSIHERHRSESHIGAGIVVWPNAAFVLEQLGVLSDIAAVAGRPKAMRRISRFNQDLGVLDIGLIEKLMGYRSFSILRRDFQNILISRLESFGVSIQYDHDVACITSKGKDETVLHFRNGNTLHADLVVGADGRMASCARRYVTGSSEPVYQRFVNWIGVYDGGNASFNEDEIADYWGVGERFGIVPVGSNKAYWAGGASEAAIGSRNPGQYKDELSGIFSAWPEPIQKIIACTPVERINKIYVHDHDPVQTWHKDRVVLVGDAAHASLPTSGQGACQALEDAWHLANCVVAYSHDLNQAFEEFTRRRLQKTTGITLAGRALASSLFNRDAVFCLGRDDNSRGTNFTAAATAMSHGWSQNLPLHP